MSGRASFKNKHLRLCVATTLTAGSAVSPVEALLLPPKPLSFSSAWDCRSNNDNSNKRLCRSKAGIDYRESMEYVVQANNNTLVEKPYGYSSAPAPEEQAYESAEVRQPLSEQSMLGFDPVVADSAVLLELLNAPPESYVLQWQAENSRSPLERLKNQYPVLQDSTIVQYQRSGRQWYILLDGPYPSRIAAMAALKMGERAALASRIYPWTRSVASIQHLDLVRPNKDGYESVADSENSMSMRENTSGRYYANESNAMTSGRESFVPNQQIIMNHRGVDSRYNSSLNSGYKPNFNQSESMNRQYSNNGSVQQHLNYGKQFSPNISQQQSMRGYSNGYPYVETPVDNSKSANGQTTPVSYVYPENHTTDHQSRQQGQGRLLSSFQDDSRAEYKHPPQQTSTYNNDLRYAMASTGNQSILPPKPKSILNQGPVYSNNNNQAFRSESARQKPDYDMQQSKYSGYGHNQEMYRETPEPLPSSRNNNAFSEIGDKEFSEEYDQSYVEKALNASPGSYTIQWAAANKKSSIERVQLRYPGLQNARIIHYSKRNADWYVLVGDTFNSKREAQEALALPPYSRLISRLYPWVRSVKSLQKMISVVTGRKKSDKVTVKKVTPLQKIISTAESRYTIQWYAANKPELIKKMQRRFPELSNAVTVHFKRNHKDWYVLLQGQFRSSTDAISTIKSARMRDAARFLQPWTRPVNTLRKLDIQGQG
ncbi:MAG: hypothetical protein QS721_03075 [Candidatus Endonucleobacter sp. (ex Gigantidas childressi)]|nr:hypothetical protein [Candidatus Endonucleobacter sp. (ex Gigantidas childressi)]